jgi:aminomethyltransferase
MKTPLHDRHLALDGKMVPYAGWSMPVQYPTGIQAEHRAVREGAGLFDVSHMGEFIVSGAGAQEFLRYVAVNDAAKIEVRQAQYSALCHHDGTVIDDLLIYRLGRDEFLLVVNAANIETDFAWLKEHAGGFDVSLEDRSDEYGLLALQGPDAAKHLQPLVEADLDEIGYFRFAQIDVAGVAALVARTGYTGEDGFEIYLPAPDAPRVWDALDGVTPCGLGARDSLRLEVGYPLYGNDLDREHTALESGLGWVVKLDRGDFIGREALAAQKEAGLERKLVGIRLTGRGFPRPGYPVVVGEDEVGVVTSGTLSPSLGVGIALAFVPVEVAEPGTEVGVRIRNRDIAGVVERPPFYREGSIRR